VADSGPIKKAETVKKGIPSEERVEPAPKSKRQVVNSRMATYRTSVATVYEKSHGNPLVGKVQSFLTDPEPSVDRLSKLVTEIIENKAPKTKEKKKLTKTQVHELLQSAICYWLDKICFNGKDLKKLTSLKKIVEKLKKEKMSVSSIYKYWNSNEVKAYEPDLDDVEIKKILV
jgi:thymidylate synthase